MSSAQDCPAGLYGAWTCTLPARQIFEIELIVHETTAAGAFAAEIRSTNVSEAVSVWKDGEHLRFQSLRLPIAFDGTISTDDSRIGGFVQHASTINRVELLLDPEPQQRTWKTDWTPFGVSADSLRLDLYIEDDGEGGAGGYWFFRDQRLPGLWGYGLECQGNKISLGEKNLGLRFNGQFDNDRDVLRMTISGVDSTVPLTFRRMAEELVPSRPDNPELPARHADKIQYFEHAPATTDDGWLTSNPSSAGVDIGRIQEMVRAVADEELLFTHSVLIARQGKLVVEEYFYGFNRDTWHDMRSASKTIASTLIGLAIEENYIKDVHATALSFFPYYRYYANWDARKARITIHDCLTMSSGLDANDSDRRSAASEGTYQSQTQQPDWIKLALDAQMINDPGAQPLYGGANPLILGGILSQAIDEPVEWFAHRILFDPLGIKNYKFFLDPTGIVYMGGGMYMRPRDMLKYGQLYLNGGVWKGKRILSEKWIRESWDQYGRLAPLDRNGHQYGYLWWHHEYNVGGRTVKTMEARGNGGQYIFVVPSLDLVVVITAGNFRTGKTRQPEEIMKQYILPAVQPANDKQ
jgi:CubicO group peptidase (beta-lactamase class C family)